METAEDPIDRMVKDIHFLKEEVKKLSARAEPATKDDLQGLLQAQRQLPPVSLKADQVAQVLLSSLQKGMVSPSTLEQAAAAGVGQLRQAGQQTADQVQRGAEQFHQQVYQTGMQAADRILEAAHYSQKQWSSRIGFTSPKAALWILGTCLLLVGGMGCFAGSQYQQAHSARQSLEGKEREVAFFKTYDAWIDKHYPKIWPRYEREELHKPQGK